MKVSIIIPVFNEEKNLERLLPELYKVCVNNEQYEFEIIIVDDGSTDNTLQFLDLDDWKNAGIKYISFSQNYGAQLAILAGYEHASGDLLLTMDGDGQHSPSYIIPMIETFISQRINVVQMIQRSDSNSFGFQLRKLLYHGYSLITGVPLAPMGADFRIISSKLLALIRVHRSRDIMFRILLPLLGASIFSMDYRPRQRFFGTTRYTLLPQLKFMMCALTYSQLRLRNVLRMLVLFLIAVFIIGFIFKGTAFLGISGGVMLGCSVVMLLGYSINKYRMSVNLEQGLYGVKKSRLDF